jgi:excisionase family DNA binding protein
VSLDRPLRGPLLSATDLAARLGTSRRWVYAQVEQHGLPAYRFGRALAFDPRAVQAWLEGRRVGDWEHCAKNNEMVEFGVVQNVG